MAKFIRTSVAALLLVATFQVVAIATPEHQPVDLSYSLVSNQLSQYEPVVLMFRVSNNLEQTVTVDLGLMSTRNFQFAVTRPDGSHVELRPPLKEGLRPVGVVKVKPGESFTKELLLNDWFDFSLPGKYRITATLSSPITDEQKQTVAMSPEANLELMVLSRDEKQLQTTCADLLKKITSAPSYTQAEEAARALSAIKDPVVVPYLQQATTSWHLEPITIKALSEIGDATATEALVSLLESKEHETSALSRVALARIEARTPDASLKERIRSVLESPNLQNQKQQ